MGGESGLLARTEGSGMVGFVGEGVGVSTRGSSKEPLPFPLPLPLPRIGGRITRRLGLENTSFDCTILCDDMRGGGGGESSVKSMQMGCLDLTLMGLGTRVRETPCDAGIWADFEEDAVEEVSVALGC